MKYLYYKNFLSMLDNAEGIKIFRHFYIQNDNGEIIDILQDGNLSCATFVSSILYLNHLISSQHTTVDSTIKDLLNSGWKLSSFDDLSKGDVLIWDEAEDQESKKLHKHIGFYIDKKTALSNDYRYQCIRKHKINFMERKIIQCFKYENI